MSQSRREVLRRQQEAQARQKRLNRIVAVGAGIVALVLVAVFAVIAFQQWGGGSGATGAPPNATAARDGITVNPGKAKPGAPTLQIYLDYQCPWCKTLEDTHGKTIEELAAAGDINLVYSTKTFLDPGLRNDASYRSAVAAACADVAGVYAAYHDEVFANQPTTEGEGYSTDQLRTTFAQAAGINGDKLTAFQQCYDARTFGNFVKGVEEASAKAGVNTTPTVKLNGTPLDNNQLLSATPEQLKTLLTGG